MKIIYNVNDNTIEYPFKWTSRIDIFWEVHPLKFEVVYEEKVGVNSWESTVVIYNEVPLDGQTFVYTRTIGDYYVNSGTFISIDWNQMIPKDYLLLVKHVDEKPVESVYRYKVQTRMIEEDVFFRYFKGDMDDIRRLVDSIGSESHNGFICKTT